MAAEHERDAMIEELYNKYYDKMVLHCAAMVRFYPALLPVVEECVQEVFILALKKHRELASHPDIEGWLFRCCMNRMDSKRTTYLRRSNRHAYSVDEESVPELFDPRDSFREFEENRQFYRLIDRIHALLLENETRIFDEYFLQGYDIDEVAAHVGKSKRSVKSTIYRIRERLKKSFFLILMVFCVYGASFWNVNK